MPPLGDVCFVVTPSAGGGEDWVLVWAARPESSDLLRLLPLTEPALTSVSPVCSTSQPPGLSRVQFCLPQRTPGTRGCDLCHGRGGTGVLSCFCIPETWANPENPPRGGVWVLEGVSCPGSRGKLDRR